MLEHERIIDEACGCRSDVVTGLRTHLCDAHAGREPSFVGCPPFGWESVLIDGLHPLPAAPGRRHSPTGYAWGYGGSGPAELARAILYAVLRGTPDEEAACDPAVYQAFKWDVIAALPAESFRLEGTKVRAWYAHWKQQAKI